MKHPSTHYSADQWYDYLKKSDADLLAECRVDTFRGSGRGGQKRNKTSNAVRLTLSYLSASASDSRSRTTNQQNALKRLRMAIALDAPPSPFRKMNRERVHSDCSRYISNHLIRLNPKNPDYLIFIGHLIDMIMWYRGDMSKVAEELDVSNSQIHRFIQKSGQLMEKVKALRKMDEDQNYPDHEGIES